jgi:hypothetical protein
MDRLITRPAASLERKVVGGGLVGLLTVMALAALRYLRPEDAEVFAPYVEPLIVYVATLVGGYMTRLKMPVPVESAQPLE